MQRRSINLMLGAAACMPCLLHASEPFPSRPMRYLVSAAAGTPPDLLARIVAERLAARLGQPVLVDNRVGAIGSIGLRALAAAPPDGHTIGALAMPWLVGTNLLPSAGVDPTRDLQAVALLAWNHAVLFVQAASPWKTVRDIVAAAKAQPDSLKYSSAGSATPGHLAAKLLERETAVRMRHIPYKGAVANLSALLAGDVDFTFGHPGIFAPHVRSGKLRSLAAASQRRLASFPELPTMEEAGAPGVVVSDWQALVVPRSTPREIVDRLHAAVAAILSDAELRQRLEAMGIETAVAGPDELTAHIATESSRWAQVVRSAGITAD